MRAFGHWLALAKASEISGGIEALAEHLHEDPSRVRGWLGGHATIPGHVFRAASEIVSAGSDDEKSDATS